LSGEPGPDSARTPQDSGGESGIPPWLPVVLAPVILVCAVTAGVALVAAAFGWHREEMLFVAAGVGIVAALPSILLMYRQSRERYVAVHALANVQARVGGIVESAMDAIVAIDENQRIVLFNAAAETVFQRPRATVIGKKIDVLMPERFHGAHHTHIERFGQKGKGKKAESVRAGRPDCRLDIAPPEANDRCQIEGVVPPRRAHPEVIQGYISVV